MPIMIIIIMLIDFEPFLSSKFSSRYGFYIQCLAEQVLSVAFGSPSLSLSLSSLFYFFSFLFVFPPFLLPFHSSLCIVFLNICPP